MNMPRLKFSLFSFSCILSFFLHTYIYNFRQGLLATRMFQNPQLKSLFYVSCSSNFRIWFSNCMQLWVLNCERWMDVVNPMTKLLFVNVWFVQKPLPAPCKPLTHGTETCNRFSIFVTSVILLLIVCLSKFLASRSKDDIMPKILRLRRKFSPACEDND